MALGKLYRFLAILLLSFVVVIGAAWSQDSSNGAPDFSVQKLEDFKTRVQSSANVTDERKAQIIQYYDDAIANLQTAAEQREEAARLQRELDNVPLTIEELKAAIKTAQSTPIRTDYPDPETMTGEALLRFERDLITREGDMRTFKAEVTRYEAELATLPEQGTRDNLAAARETLATLTAELAAFGSGQLEAVTASRRIDIEAHLYRLRMQISALELEIAGQSSRQQILTLRRDLAELNAERAEQEVIALQNQTGKRRVSLAEQERAAALENISATETLHPLVIDYAAGNVAIAEDLLKVSQDVSAYPKLQAEARSRLENIQSDLTVAENLTSLPKINRQSSETLRRLRDQRPSINSIQSRADSNQAVLLRATQKGVQVREQLRNMPIGQINADALLSDWRQDDPEAVDLTELDLTALNNLYQTRRELLLDVSEASLHQVSESQALGAVQSDVLKTTESLTNILDQNLLWLPSVSAIDLSWPLRVIRGTGSVFKAQNLNRSFSVLTEQMKRYWPLTFTGLALAFGILAMRRRLRLDVIDAAKSVGRVQKDHYWITPSVIMTCAIITAPIPLLLLLTGFLYQNSGAPDVFISSLGKTGIEVSGFLWFFLMWKEWGKEKSLFDAHYQVSSGLRKNITQQLNWFIPVAGVLIALVTLTQKSREPDVYGGFSLLVFILTAGVLAWFGYKILWKERGSKAGDRNWFKGNRKILPFLLIGLPLIAAMLAAYGYYDTAHVLLSRLFFSSGLVVATFVVYGLIRRTLVIAQRRLALRQAVERREQMLRAREQIEAAEERGDAAPPQVDYDEIDLETISRQSLQLLNTFIIFGFAVSMWIIWRDLFPALSVFDRVNLWQYSFSNEAGEKIIDNVTLWNLIQSLAIGVLTFISAKNLPGFLEVFILNRSGLDRGTRYATVSVLGYIIMAIGFVMAFNKLGMDWSQLQWIFAALGVGIGFGLQEIIANFISGLIILFERPIRVGDYITIGNQSGTVNQIKIRATTLSDLDNREIFIPNKELITQKVTNWTLTDSITRIIIPVGIAYGSDTDKAREIMLKVIKSNSKVLEKPKSNVFFLGFGESSLDFELRIFVRSVDDRFGVSHDLHTEINKALSKAKIEIPFPQRDMRIVSQAPLPEQLKGKRAKSD